MNLNNASKLMPEELLSKTHTGNLLENLDEVTQAEVLELRYIEHTLQKKNMTYNQQLNNPRWKAKRILILERDNYSCMLCDSNNKLHVHHIKYIGKAWEAPDEYLVTLCSICHKTIHDKNITIAWAPTFDGMIIEPEEHLSNDPLTFEFDLSKIGAMEEDMPYLCINRYGDTGEFFIVDLREWGYKSKKAWISED